MSTVINIATESEFKNHTVSLPPTALLCVFFHTPWAAPCTQMATVLLTLASSYPPRTPPIISFISVNAEDLAEISESYDVTAVPFLVLQRDGKVLESVSGSDAGKVRDAVDRHAGKGGNTGKVGLPPKLEAIPQKVDRKETNGNGAVNGGNGTTNSTKNLSGYVPNSSDPKTAPEMSSTADQTAELNKRLQGLVKAAPVMLFMKGTPSTPQCGFSRSLVGLLREQGVRYGFFNILADEEVRQGLKLWADWPTFPQLWVSGELVGGLDIVKEELDHNPDFFKDYSAGKGKGGMAAPDAQIQPTSASI
ncbi:monothiol glutaredoxin grx4 [Schaereria dolodes]|nr:monothiol glutaredoxin grx4 [Schaereria dolodes]